MMIYKTRAFGDTYQLKADFAQASCPIMQESSEPGDQIEWSATPWQVADFGHRPEAAMRAYLMQIVMDSGDDLDDYDDEIESAVSRMTRTHEEQTTKG